MSYLLEGMGFIALGVPDLDVAVDFYQRAVHLQVTERAGRTVYMSAGTGHHWLRLDGSMPPGTYRLGYEVVNEAALDVVADRLTEHKVPWSEGRGYASDRIDRSIVFTDPNGVEVEIFFRMGEFPLPPVHQPLVRMRQILHAVWGVHRTKESFRFYHEIFGSRDSDWREELIVFVRNGNGYHHSMGLGTVVPPGALDHFCFLVESVDDVMRARNIALQLGLTLRMDILRHAPSNGVSVYVCDPVFGANIEFVAEHRQVPEDAVARIMPNLPGLGDVWNPHPDAINAQVPLLVHKQQ